MRIQHNIMAMNAYRNYTNNTSALAKNLEKLSSGYRINRAGDDAAGLAISEKMRAQITALGTAQKNVKDGISLVKTAEGATQEIHDMLNRMVDLATQSANGTYQNEVDREAIELEFNELKAEIDRIADSSNFNGIKLLDGSLDAKAAVTNVDIIGVNSTKSVGSKASYVNTQGHALNNAAFKDGDTFEFTVALDNNVSYTVKLVATADKDGVVNQLVSADGKRTYKITDDEANNAGQAKATTAEIDAAVLAELKQTDLAKDFNISAAAGKVTLEAIKEGASTPAVTAMDAEWTVAGTRSTKDMAVTPTAGLDEGREIKAADIIEYNGMNYDDAVFTINGHKFVLMTESMTGASLGKDGDDMNATFGLGSDVTILVGGQDGLKATTGADNFAQNIKKIAEVTGLTVTDAVDETTLNPAAAAKTGADPDEGIRLSAGKGNGKNGLMLQIGEDSESYNQMKVAIGDMHVKALGIDSLSLGNQTDAQAAVSKIKDAINYVSSVRGTLGATQNRLEHTQNNLSVMKENIQDAESTIRDTDVAEEMMAYTKNNILVQSAQAMLAQANQIPQGVLQLLG